MMLWGPERHGNKKRFTVISIEIYWHFNQPAVSHKDGVLERLIHCVRRILRSMIGKRLFDDEIFDTFSTEVEKNYKQLSDH